MRHRPGRFFPVTAAALACACVRCALPAAGPATNAPQAAVDELLATDRAFAAESARTDEVNGLTAMFSAEVIVPLPGHGFAEGRTAAIEALRANADDARARAEWLPVRGGVSADGQHGFTFGFMTVHRPDGSTVPLKYMAYWIREAHGWRVAAYKRRVAPRAVTAPYLMPPSLPRASVPPTADPAVLARHRASLEQAELSFARDAQSIGLRAAFTRYGSDDAVNMGGPNDPGFVVGAAAIGAAVGAGTPDDASPVSWAPDRVIVASSGDLGITFGMIRSNAPQPGPPSPFFTIWRRDGPDRPWRYIAE